MKRRLGVVGLAAVLSAAAGFSFYPAAFAKNDSSDGMEHAREAHATGSTLEIHISDNGNVLVRGAKVTSVGSSSFAAATAWGPVSLAWTVNVDSGTEFVRKYGGASSLAEISVGDFVSFTGSIDQTASALTIKAKAVKNWSIQKKHAAFYGTVSSVSSSSASFVLAAESNATLTVKVGSSTALKKGDSAAAFGDIVVGSKVTAQGLFNSQTNTLEADRVKIHLAGALRTTLEGKIKTPPGATAPTTMVMTVKNVDYTVDITIDTSVLNAIWLRIPLGNMKMGDNVRVYGTVNANATVDATVVRDISIR